MAISALGLTVAPISFDVILLDACLGAVAIAMPRIGVRLGARRERRTRNEFFRRTIIVGAGAAGGMIVRELVENTQLDMVPVAVLDDDPRKHGLRLNNVPVLGDLRALARIAEEIGATDVVIAMPSAPGRVIREVVREARAAGLETRTVPGIVRDPVGREMRERAPPDRDSRTCCAASRSRRTSSRSPRWCATAWCMVTGAGGSIGSELCRQLARLGPRASSLLGRGENSIFELLQELARTFPDVAVAAGDRRRARPRAHGAA